MGKQEINKCNEIVFGHRSTPQPHFTFFEGRMVINYFSPPLSASVCRSSPASCFSCCLTGCLFVFVLSEKLTRSQNEYENICIGVPLGGGSSDGGLEGRAGPCAAGAVWLLL